MQKKWDLQKNNFLEGLMTKIYESIHQDTPNIVIGDFSRYKIIIYKNDGAIPHFHFVPKNGKIEGCIRLDKPAYLNHKNNQNILSFIGVNSLIKFLTAIHSEGKNNFKYIIEKWNYYNPVNIIEVDTNIPEYRQLKWVYEKKIDAIHSDPTHLEGFKMLIFDHWVNRIEVFLLIRYAIDHHKFNRRKLNHLKLKFISYLNEIRDVKLKRKANIKKVLSDELVCKLDHKDINQINKIAEICFEDYKIKLDTSYCQYFCDSVETLISCLANEISINEFFYRCFQSNG